MIPRDTVEKIVDAAHVEEVVGEFVSLKKRGANLLGLCPFHGEKTPSFTVSPSKGIYKCFGCGKAGNTVNFVMEHLKLSYPEALRWLAKKYNIDIVEKEFTPEEKAKQTERESMLIVMQYAQRYFTEVMHSNDEGRSIGLEYFRERGLEPAIIEKFQLGFSLEERTAFTKAAIAAGYRPEYLLKTGMSILSNRYVEGAPIGANDLFDRYAGRVMFPIHDDGGRVVAFGGRTLSKEKKVAKYINSPETEIYHKSRILYGLWLGKKAIQVADKCFLVEGYMDVIAMHQAEVENVVASSGTSLTVEQVKSIHRFTKNIVVLYDGDEAGQKASARAIPLLLEEGMNVRLLQFPDNDDPDSFSRKVGKDAFREYIDSQTQDFIFFQARKLNRESANDPIRKATVIREIVENIALIPDNIIRSVYIKECAGIMEMEELILQTEVNKIRRKSGQKTAPEEALPKTDQIVEELLKEDKPSEADLLTADSEEKQLLKNMLRYGNVLISIEAEDDNDETHQVDITVAEYILFELWRDNITFENPIHQAVLDEYIFEISNQRIPMEQDFIRSSNPLISSFTIDHVVEKHVLSRGWGHFGVTVPSEVGNVKKDTIHQLFSLKEKKLNQLIREKQESLKETGNFEEIQKIQRELLSLSVLKGRVNKLLGRVVIR